MSNAKTRKIFLANVSRRPAAAEKFGVKFLAGPLFGIDHKIVAVMEADSVESVMNLLAELQTAQWNSVEVQPYMSAEQAAKMVESVEPLY